MSASRSSSGHILLQIISPERIVYEKEVDWLQVPLPDGLLGIWPEHASLIASLSRGTIRFCIAEDIKEMAVGEGILRVDRGQCIVLTGAPISSASDAYDVDPDALSHNLEDSLHESLSDEEIEDLQRG